MPEKKTVAKKTTTKKKMNKGETYECEVCGLSVMVDEACGCMDVCDIICCDQPMKEKKSRAKAAKK